MSKDTLVSVGFWKTIVMARRISTNFYQEHPSGLQLDLYYDDVEICNLLGSKQKIYKLGMYIICLHTCMYNVHVQDSLTLVQPSLFYVVHWCILCVYFVLLGFFELNLITL